MYKQKIAITISSDFDKEKLYDEFIILMNSFCRTGQIMGGVESPYVAGNELICYQTTLERSSLDSQNNDEWVNLRIKNLEQKCNSKIKGLTDKDRTDIESWEGDYVSCDNLNMGCNVGEKWAIKQMSTQNLNFRNLVERYAIELMK